MICVAIDRDRLLEKHLSLVPAIVRRLFAIHRLYPLDFDDAISAGNAALWRASRKYQGGTTPDGFRPYAARAVHNAIVGEWRWLNRTMRRGAIPLDRDVAADEGISQGDLIDLAQAMGKLAPWHRQVLSLRFGLDGEPALTGAEMALRLGLSRRGAQERLRDALEASRTLMLGELREA